MITNVVAGHNFTGPLTSHLMAVITIYALLVLSLQRQWIKPTELTYIGGAAGFWAVAWILAPLLPLVRARFPEPSVAIPVSFALITPLIVAMAFGLLYVRKKVLSPDAKPNHEGDTRGKKATKPRA